MTDSLHLYQVAEGAGIPVVPFSLPACGSLCVQDSGGNCYIGIDEKILETEREKTVHLAHELGHCLTGSFYNIYAARDIRQKREHQADKWAIAHLITPEALDDAVAMGCTDLWTLAEHFGVTEDFIRKAVCWYTHGNLEAELYF